MNLSLKILLPITGFLILLFFVLFYVISNLQAEERLIAENSRRIGTLSQLNDQLNRQQSFADFATFSYHISQEQIFLDQITQAEIEKSKILDQMSPFITTVRGREIAQKYIEKRLEGEQIRGALIDAIQNRQTKDIKINFDRWLIQTEQKKAALGDLNAYNINSLEETLVSLNKFRQQVFGMVIFTALCVLVLITIFYFYLRQIITKPIVKLAQASRRISQGDFDSIVEFRSSDELGLLTQNFNEMATNLGLISEKEKELDFAKDEFLSMAAHHLRTPLGTTRWNIELLLKNKFGKLTAGVKKVIGAIGDSNLELTWLVNDLLDV
ncbi:HAMP domain-containing protein [Candidatus Curtissbacteria bacterium]|nr:HAMP domain-containing protein [Candidatus Curtissbacteria bacterium]